MKGIYCYKDKLKNNEIVYIGKDTRIDKNKRYNSHKAPSNYNDQPFNKILQNNLNRYTYEVLKKGDFTDGLLNALEIIYIRRYKPQFNFTIGGDGTIGYKHTKETKKKISEANKGKKRTLEQRKEMSKRAMGEKNGMYGKTHSDKVKKAVSQRCKNVPITEKHKQNISKTKNTSGYYRVIKEKHKTCKEGFIYRYSYKENGKQKKIRSTTLEKLEEKVRNKGLDWIKYDEGYLN